MVQTTVHKLFKPLKRPGLYYVWSTVRALVTAFLTPVRWSLISGHFRSSLARRSMARDGTPVPWYTYPAIAFLAQRDFRNRDVLEFGGGQSTYWWAARARSVTVIEEDARWCAAIRASSPGNVDIRHVPATNAELAVDVVVAYLRSRQAKYDVIVIDGASRRAMIGVAFEFLAPGGAVIFDNAEGYGFVGEIAKRDVQRVDFFGYAPGVWLPHCTSLVFRETCFLMRPDIAIPLTPVC
jgi:predicted O-methyltransferase YrrM